jgi:simple sugar transport system permease protein
MKTGEHGRWYLVAQAASFLVVLLLIFVVFSILIFLSNFSFIAVYWNLLVGAFGSSGAIAQTLIRMSPVLFCSLGLLIAFRCGMWNIGAEGQLYWGALIATVVGVYVRFLPSTLHILLAILASFLCGGLWAGICGYLKTKFNANEVITTLLSNFVAYWLTFYVLKFHLQPKTAFNPSSLPVQPTAILPTMLKGTLLHAGIPLGIGCAIIVWFIMRKTSLGYSIDTVGANKLAATYGGIKVERIILIGMFLSGGLAGMAGMGEVLGIHHLLIRNISPNYGFIAIAAVFIARLSPMGSIVVSLFFGAILTGGRHLQTSMGIPTHLVDVLVALFIVFMLLQPLVEKRLNSFAVFVTERGKEG